MTLRDLCRLASLVYYLPSYGPGALTSELTPVASGMTFEDMEQMHPDLFGAS